jgi:hypothetical protein
MAKKNIAVLFSGGNAFYTVSTLAPHVRKLFATLAVESL